MADKPTYEELAEKLANFVRANFYNEEKRINLPPVMVFHNLYESALELVSEALTSVGLTKCIDGGGRYVFTCEPNKFRETARSNEPSGCSYDMLVLCACQMVHRNVLVAEDLFNCLVRLEICQPELIRVSKPLEWDIRLESRPVTVGVFRGGEAFEMATTTVGWTEKHAFYRQMMDDWMDCDGDVT